MAGSSPTWFDGALAVPVEHPAFIEHDLARGLQALPRRSRWATFRRVPELEFVLPSSRSIARFGSVLADTDAVASRPADKHLA